MRTTLKVAVAAAPMLAALWAPVAANPVEEFYRGKQLRFIISSATGGDYDQWSRLIARYLGKYIPGNPTIIPQNMPGGGQIIATNHLFTAAAQDGTVIGMIGRNLPNDALVKKEGVRFDPVKFNWLGSPELTNRVCAAIEGAPVQKAQDLFQHELLVGGAGAGTAVSNTPTLLSRLLGMKFKLVEGYGNSQAILLAIERGEVQGICQSLSSLRGSRPDWFESGKLKVLFNTERNAVPGLNAPTVFDFTKTDEQRKILALYTSSVEFGRPIVAPPNVPKERVEALRKALADTLKDPELLEEAKKQGMEMTYVSGEELEKLIADLMSTPAEIVDKMREMTK
ncbi:MAG TPA: tripartite tricarboxylate transporter substrate-binding protein [Xanthobacteraceae bacterium]|nr:tripartite tricarboxylate transporter substrate-binding protein [Xanthobacteraceae bacterium]